MIISLSTKRTGNIAAMNIYKSFTHKMAAKTSWHRCETKLRHCYPVYTPIRSPIGDGVMDAQPVVKPN